MRTAALSLLMLCLGWLPPAGAADADRPLVLVAAPELQDPLYGGSVLVVTPVGSDQHAGFIVNRPTNFKLGKAGPIYLGGPIEPELIFALVERNNSPGAKSIQIAPGLYAAYDGSVVDGIIKSDPQHARLMAGLVVWRAGELRDEIKRGAWYTLEPDAALVMRNPEGLWEELVRRSQQLRNAI
jgi:putative transcriptional regulator